MTREDGGLGDPREWPLLLLFALGGLIAWPFEWLKARLKGESE